MSAYSLFFFSLPVLCPCRVIPVGWCWLVSTINSTFRRLNCPVVVFSSFLRLVASFYVRARLVSPASFSGWCWLYLALVTICNYPSFIRIFCSQSMNPSDKAIQSFTCLFQSFSFDTRRGHARWCWLGFIYCHLMSLLYQIFLRVLCNLLNDFPSSRFWWLVSAP